MAMHSRMFAIVRRYYDLGLWPLSRVRDAVGRWITEEEYQEITGTPWATEGPQTPEGTPAEGKEAGVNG